MKANKGIFVSFKDQRENVIDLTLIRNNQNNQTVKRGVRKEGVRVQYPTGRDNKQQ